MDISIKKLVLASIICSVATLFTHKLGYGEIFPFSDWKLFTQPTCSYDTVSYIKIYGKTNNDWALLPLKPSPDFDFEDSYYYSEYLTKKIVAQTSQDDIHKLKHFTKEMYPEIDSFQLRIKSYKVTLYTTDSTLYNEKIILQY